MCYFHINDLLPEVSGIPSKGEYEQYYKEPGTLKNRYLRYIKTNLGKESAWKKLYKLISGTPFENIDSADVAIDWESVDSVELLKRVDYKTN